MCGIAGQFGPTGSHESLERMLQSLKHRGPDAQGISIIGEARLAHTRLSIIDLSEAGRQPFHDVNQRYSVIYNGEIYNYLELKKELEDHWNFRTKTDTEVLLAAYVRWGQECLDRLVGMFAFAIWDEQEKRLFAARDRFGVKPLFWHKPKDGGIWIASEIKAFHEAGVPKVPNETVWATYLATATYDEGESTFWEDIYRTPPGGWLTWSSLEGFQTGIWYDCADQAKKAGLDRRQDDEVSQELLSLLQDTVRLRFRADVPVGVCLSGGLDSSLLWALVRQTQPDPSKILAFTFTCGDTNYDETPWVESMLGPCKANGRVCLLRADEVPGLAERVQSYQDEPFGGFPTLGMAKVHEQASQEGVIVLLDGNGLDEGWAGYDYYLKPESVDLGSGPVQGSNSPSCRPDCLQPEFEAKAKRLSHQWPWQDPLKNIQYRDLRYSKIPRAMRFADRVSMMWSRELREPFLDHRIVELGLRQPSNRKVRDGQTKWLPRQIARDLLPSDVSEAPKRPVQTPQREWLRGPLKAWADNWIESGLKGWGSQWLDAPSVRQAWAEFQEGGDNSFPIWQWISLGLISK